MLTGSAIRAKFLQFFEQRGHRIVHSSSLVPHNDPTLLFTNAGMNQFKDVFLGLEKRDYNRATTSQKCVRAGGKHNDLENVGFTNRHHTFFEMLGNFSFGDYFKPDAIAYAWELITSPEWFGIDATKLYVTIFEGQGDIPADEEAAALWLAQRVPVDRIFRMGMKDNFWQMGDTGPCGPCSEIHYDMGVAASDKVRPECATGTCKFPCECGRYVEIWNLVFMQYERKLGPYPGGSSFELLPRPSIDTGAGLERLAAVLQGVVSNYDTDLFTPLIARAAELCGTSLEQELAKEATGGGAASLRVIADHARAATFLISDGVIPANEGRGYVLKKIIRRAIRHGRLLGQSKPFLSDMVFAVRDAMTDAYPELDETADRVAKIVLAEETRFASTIELGLQKLEEIIRQATINAKRSTYREQIQLWKSDPERSYAVVDAQRALDSLADTLWLVSLERIKTIFHDLVAVPTGMPTHLWIEFDKGVAEQFRSNPPTVSGEEAFKLYDTYGLPADFIVEACKDAGARFDEASFNAAMAEQKTRARASWKGAVKQTANPAYQSLPTSNFEGYSQTSSPSCEVLAILAGGVSAPELAAGVEGEVILDHTPFYAESGGQVGDRGILLDSSGVVVAEVTSTYSPVQGVRAHKVITRQPIHVGDKLDAVIDGELRRASMRHHTATHLLHAALRETLGTHVKQAGSLVSPGHLRFDFSHFAAVADEELQDIEDSINREVLGNTAVVTIADVPIDTAVNEYHAMALFGEKYGDKVRVVKIGDYSVELCGGTHTAATGEIGLIKILSEGSVSSGVRRIEAVAGDRSLAHFRKDHELEKLVHGIVGRSDDSPSDALRAEFEKREGEIKRLTRELDQLRMKSAASSVASVDEKIREVKGVKVLAHRVDGLDAGQMRTLVDQLRQKLGTGVAVLGSAQGEDKVTIIVGVTKDLTARIQAGKVVNPIAQKVGGSGGGKPDMAQAGGKDVAALDAALAAAYDVVGELLG